MKAEQLIDVGSITPKLLNPHLRRAIFGAGGGTTVVNTTEEPSNVPIYICRLASTGNIHLDGTTTSVDSVTLAEGDTVLVNAQTDLVENGIYFVFSTGWVRYTDIVPGMLITINEGTVNSDTVWMLTSNNFVVGSDDIVFEKILPVVALPAGTIDKTLRHDGTDWVANDILKLGTSFATFSKQVRMGNNGLTFTTGNIVGNSATADLQINRTTTLGATDNAIVIARSDGLITLYNAVKLNNATANTYLGANASKQIVSIPSPNIIKYNTALISDTLGNWTNVPTLTFSLEANVTYELELYLSLGNNAGRNGSIRIDTSSAAYVHRPFIIGNSNGANPAVIYINDSTATQPFNLDNSTELQVQNADSGSIVMLKGIITSTVNIPMATIQIKTRDIGSAFQCKEYSYIKLSR